MVTQTIKDGVNVFSGEGGGVKVVMQLAICAKAEELTGISVSDYFQVYGGTSAGALAAAAMASGKSATESLKIVTELCGKIFPQVNLEQLWKNPIVTLKQAWNIFYSGNGLFSNKYDPTPLKESLEKIFGDLTLADLSKPLIIPVYKS